MIIVASIYLRFYIEVGVGVGTFLPTATPPKIPSNSDSMTPNLTPQPWLQLDLKVAIHLNTSVICICEALYRKTKGLHVPYCALEQVSIKTNV
jgi:hypothetical protein